MPPDFFPFGADTLAVPAYLVSDENDPAYRAWLVEHPDAFDAGTWTRPERRPRARPPVPGQPRPIGIDPAAMVPTRDLIARSGLSTQEFLEIAAAVRAGGPGSNAPHHEPLHDARHANRHGDHHRPAAEGHLTARQSEQRDIEDLAPVMYNEASTAD